MVYVPHLLFEVEHCSAKVRMLTKQEKVKEQLIIGGGGGGGGRRGVLASNSRRRIHPK